MRRVLLFLMVFVVLVSGCTGKSNNKYTFKMIEPIESATNVFKDEGIIIEFLEITNQISVNIINNTNHLVKIIWDNCVYTGFDGQPSRVIHYGVKYIDKEKPIAPSLIPPKTKLEEGIVPSSNIVWSLNTWAVVDIINPYAPPADGQTFSLYLCLGIGKEEVYYDFKFQVNKIVDEKNISGSIINFNPKLPNADYTTGKFE